MAAIHPFAGNGFSQPICLDMYILQIVFYPEPDVLSLHSLVAIVAIFVLI